MQRPDLAASGRFANYEGRARNRQELDAIISQWTCCSPKNELAARLQSAGVAAAPVSNGADVAMDEALIATRFIQRLDHPEAGSHSYPTLAYHLSRTPGGVSCAAPCFGEQNDAVLRDLLGLSPPSIRELKRSGAVASAPRFARLGALTKTEPTNSSGSGGGPPIGAAHGNLEPAGNGMC